ncbi:hypothetical protein CK203_046821 [Vitis vinifera]|uniref:Integrase zinc-binding domain-containing protein n=1 Tax=Vitis vinifera TaxID=29760 RepID=A0A438HYD1_VITVI|nr:hypothetical protein CK203_046821 [Vitis vinifera]
MGRVATEQSNGSYTWRQGLLLYKGRVIILNYAPLKAKLLHEMHDTKVGGHSAVLRTFKKLGQQFYWSVMHRVVQNHIKGCDICQKIKIETLALARLLQPLSILCQVWDDITLDFIEGLPVSQGRDTIMKNLWKALLSSTGCPSPLLAIQIRSSSATFGRNFSRCRAPNCNSVPYTTHKQMAKRKSSIVASNSIYGVLFTSGHGYGVPTYLGLNIVHEVDQQLMSRDELLQQLKANLERSMNRMKQLAYQKRKDIAFSIGN